MTEFVQVRHPDVEVPAVVARSALAHLDPGWTVVGDATSPFGDVTGGVSFDPTGHSVAEVNAYLDEHPDAAPAVLATEAAGSARKGIVEGPHAEHVTA